MNKKEFSTWSMALKTYFPRDNLLPTKEAMELWFQELHDIPFDVATAMLRKWVDTEKWPPTISEIRATCAEITNGKIPDWAEAWAEVTKAIRHYGYMQKESAYASMSPLTQKAVDYIGWYDLNMSENPDIIRAQFRQAYQICMARQIEDRQMTPELKSAITGLLEKHTTLILPETEKQNARSDERESMQG